MEDGQLITTLLFDLDGLLADTERLHRQAYQDVFGSLGIPLPDAHYDDHWIRSGKGIIEYVAENNLPIDPDIIRPMKSERYRELVVSGVEAMPGALTTLRALYGHKTMALVTASYSEGARAVLDTLGITTYFARIVTKEDAKRMKPFPDLFLHAADMLAVAPSACLVIEDAEKGIRAASAAGMQSIAVPNVHTRDNDFSLATLVLPSLNALTSDLIEGL